MIDTADNFMAPLADRWLALDHAKRALRRHVPMFLKVKKTLRILEPFIGKIDEQNARQLR